MRACSIVLSRVRPTSQIATNACVRATRTGNDDDSGDDGNVGDDGDDNADSDDHDHATIMHSIVSSSMTLAAALCRFYYDWYAIDICALTDHIASCAHEN